VHEIQAGLKITPVSRWGTKVELVDGAVDPSVDMKTPHKTQIDTRHQ
jgi:hypothetical protein